jgi:hypothetical protein
MSQGDSGDVVANITGNVSGQLAVGRGITQHAAAPPRSAEPSPQPQPTIFLSYRREDSEGHTGRMRDWLARRFGEERVFQDVDGIEPGEDFAARLGQKLAECDVLLAMIGRQWLTVTDAEGRRRIEDSRDWVRQEIEMALERGVTVVPVLVGGARMPREADLPPSLAPLARRNAVTMGPHWGSDVERLADAIERAVSRQGRQAGR